MIQVNSCQFNYQYRDRTFFPYSIAMLVGYIKSKEDLNKHFKFEKACVFRNKVNDYIKQCKNTDILLCSCYAWNWEITTYFAKEVKKLNPNCTVIFGGPQVPNHSEGFFEKYSFVDIIVHGEGEYIITNIFYAYLKDKDYSNIKGIETKKFRTPPQERINDLDDFPSPYLTNLIWDLVEKVPGVKWTASWETNRGCPYQCTFCDWGQAINTKMRNFSEERLLKEIEWFADNKIEHVHCCDANFGIYQKRDALFATKIKEQALKKHYPEQFRLTWAKFSSDKIIPIAKELQAGGILHAVTLAVQSLDQETLDIIKRENMKFDKFSALAESFRANGIPTYTEIIMGLPGETIESFKKGLETIAETKIGSIYIYHCGIFPNAPMNEPAYKEHYKIKTIRSPIYLSHSSIHNREMPEYEEITTSSFSFTLDDLKEINIYAWLIQTFHSLGILEYISHYYKETQGLGLMKFYEVLLEFCRTHESIFSEEYKKVVDYIDNGYQGKGWDHYDPNLGDLYWAIEEATWLRFTTQRGKLIDGMNSFLSYLENKMGFNNSTNILADLVKFQVFLLTTRENRECIKSEHFDYDWKNFFVNKSELKPSPKKYYYENQVVEEDVVMWCWKTIWFGRPTIKYKFHPEQLKEEIEAGMSQIIVESR